MKRRIAYVLTFLVVLYACGCKNVANYPISEPSDEFIMDGIVGKWKFREDTDRNNFYEVVKAKNKVKSVYHISAWNWSSPMPTYEADIYFSKIENVLFLNVPYMEKGTKNKGFGFLKVSDINPEFEKMTLDCVADTTMRSLKNMAEVKAYVAKNVANPSFYKAPMHFFKVK